ncbi:hypothetical protein scyTo_0009870, partial [Scyliorhinus torazame]|nr:hypothetical protein [Scyliorhinus torazame]
MRSEKAAYLILVIYFVNGWSPEGKQCGTGFYHAPNMSCVGRRCFLRASREPGFCFSGAQGPGDGLGRVL